MVTSSCIDTQQGEVAAFRALACKTGAGVSKVLLKLDTLCQWQLLGVIDCASRPPHILLPGIRA